MHLHIVYVIVLDSNTRYANLRSPVPIKNKKTMSHLILKNYYEHKWKIKPTLYDVKNFNSVCIKCIQWSVVSIIHE